MGFFLMQIAKVIAYASRQLKVHEKIIPLITWSLQLWCLIEVVEGLLARSARGYVYRPQESQVLVHKERF